VPFRRRSGAEESEMLEEAASAYEKARQFTEAQKMREGALAIRQKRATHSPKVRRRLVNWATWRGFALSAPKAMDYLHAGLVAVGDMPETVPALIQLGLDALQARSRGGEGLPAARAQRVQERQCMGRAMTWLAFIQEKDEASAAEVESLYRAAISMEDAASADQATTAEFLARYLRNHDRAGGRGAAGGAGENDTQGDRGDDYESRGRGLFGGATGSAMECRHRNWFPRWNRNTARGAGRTVAGHGVLKVTIDIDGRAKDASVLESLGMGLDEMAMEAINL